MVVVAEADVALLHLAATLDVYFVRTVDQDVADRRILEKDLQRTKAKSLIEHLFHQAFAFHAVEHGVLGVA